jgi:hypothetical protein
LEQNIKATNSVLPKNIVEARKHFVKRLHKYLNATKRATSSGTVQYKFQERPDWWPSTTEYSKTTVNQLNRSNLEVLHATLIGAIKSEAPHILLEPSGNLPACLPACLPVCFIDH